MGKIVMVVGTPGAGKTSILEAIKKETKIKIVSMGSEMMAMAAEQYGITDRDQLRVYHAQHIEKEKSLRVKILKKISGQQGNVIFDTHMVVKSGNRFAPGFNMSDIEILKGLKAIVYVDAYSKEIMERRKSDTTRNRDHEDEEDITNQREINLSLISTYAAILGIPIYIIKNNNGQLESAISQAKVIAKEAFD